MPEQAARCDNNRTTLDTASNAWRSTAPQAPFYYFAERREHRVHFPFYALMTEASAGRALASGRAVL